MKYVYDILLNFNEFFYYFFEWRENDYIEHIKRIPFVKLSNKDFKNIKNHKIVTNKDFLDKIKNVSEVYQNKNIKLIEYACVFTDGNEIIGIEFNNKGFSIMKSDLLLDEAYELLELGKKSNGYEMKYEIISRDENERINTRYEQEKILFLNREIKLLYKDQQLNKLKYLYYECFNNTHDDIEYIYNKFILFINTEWSFNHKKLYELLKLTYTNNK